MPADHLTPDTADPDRVEMAILAVLAGAAPAAVAADVPMPLADLTAAIAVYRSAGAASLRHLDAADRWYQVNIAFTDWATAEHTAATVVWPHLADALPEAGDTPWWYVRKAPHWRLRIHLATAHQREQVGDILTSLAGRRIIQSWQAGRYEPETLTFGGLTGLEIAHRLFHADSTGIIDYLQHGEPQRGDHGIRRREMSVLLCTALLRGAGLDWFERGDVWHRASQLRPLPPGTSQSRLVTTTDQIRRLLSLDTAAQSAATPWEAAGYARRWFNAMTNTGAALAANAERGLLERGIRDVLAHHLIFHWNRFGIPTPAQGILAHAATSATMNTSPQPTTEP